jgi:hypothetical protein
VQAGAVNSILAKIAGGEKGVIKPFNSNRTSDSPLRINLLAILGLSGKIECFRVIFNEPDSHFDLLNCVTCISLYLSVEKFSALRRHGTQMNENCARQNM